MSDVASATYPVTPRNRVKRKHERGHYDHETVHALLDAAALAHVSYVIDGQPYCTPTLFWREGTRLHWHGSSASRMLRNLSDGEPACLTVTHLDAFALARSGFSSSADYRSVMAFGRASLVTNPQEKAQALRMMVDRLFPGRDATLRPATAQEVKATAVIVMEIEDASAKIRAAGVSGDPDAVIIDSDYRSHGDSSSPIVIATDDIVLADFTVQRSIFHLIHYSNGGDGSLVHNVHMVDGGQQFMKSSGGDGTIDGVVVSCSRFEMTANGRDNVWGYGPQDGGTRCYTGGIDTHEATNWVVHDNVFQGIYCDATGTPRPAHGKFPELRDNMTYQGGLAEHGIHMWDSPSGGHIIARNQIINCARGIGIGLVATVYGTSVINNTVFSEFPGGGEHDVGIVIERGVDMLVAHNTVYFSHPEAYGNAIEYRWGETTDLVLYGNLTNKEIRDRDGAMAGATETNNIETAEGSWFVDAVNGNLHVTACDSVPAFGVHPQVSSDIDGDWRTDPTLVGADVCP